jgi:hypothetical protein
VKKLTILLILVALGFGAYLYAFSKRSHCFHPSFCTIDEKELSAFHQTTPPSSEIFNILDQPFTFLSSGNQSYAFLSEDGHFVLKLMKFHTTVDPQKKLRLLNGFKVATEHSPAHNGILYLHTPPNAYFSKPLTLLDRTKRKHTIDPNQYYFVLQKKAVPTGVYLKSLPDQNQRDKAISLLLEMIKTDLESGIYDDDHNIMHNTGFSKGTPMRIDVGKLRLEPKAQDPQFIADELQKLQVERINPYFQKMSK